MNATKGLYATMPEFIIRVTIFAFSLASLASCALSQEATRETSLHGYLEGIREDPLKYRGTAMPKLKSSEYSLLQDYLYDSDIKVRERALIIAMRCAFITTNTAIQQNTVERLLENIFEEKGNVQMDGFHLRSFIEDHYSVTARKLLGKQARRALREYRDGPKIHELSKVDDEARISSGRRRARLNHLIDFIGYSGSTEYMELLADIKEEFGDVFENVHLKYVKGYTQMRRITNPWLLSPAWKAALSRARLGSKEDVDFCIDLIEGYPGYDTIAYFILPEIESIRRPEINEYLYNNLDNKTEYWDIGHQWIPFGDTALKSLIRRIDDEDIKQHVDSDSLEAVRQMKAYVRLKADGDPKKLPIKDLRRGSFESQQKSYTTAK